MNEKNNRQEDETGTSTLVRDIEAWDNVELFLVSAVVSVLLIRFYLELSGYPSLGGGQIHIAHVLWGGLLLLVSVLFLLIWWTPAMRRFSALLAGLGFGTFIDEIGKFITHDNNYFYKPTAVILYTLFILLFLFARSLIGNRPLTGGERRINAKLKNILPRPGSRVSSRINFYFRLKGKLAELYRRVVLTGWFRWILTTAFIVVGVVGLVVAARTIMGTYRPDPGVSLVQMGAAAASLLCIWAGIWFLRTSRLQAYIWFKRSILINIYITQIFVFYNSQFAALGGLAFYLFIYFSLHFMIAREQ